MVNKIIDNVWDDTPVDVTAEANFIWSIANKLRGSYMPDKYGDVIIPMTIIRRFECALAATKDKVNAKYEENPNHPPKALCRISKYQFYNTSGYDLAELCTTFNKELLENYKKNIFSVMEEVWASDKERVDVVVFLNGLAIMSFELKCNFAGQSYEDAIYQYRTERNPKTRLFLFKAGCLVNFAMDLNEVYMTTKLDGQATFFLSFNMGNGEGVNAGKGNPVYEDKYSVSYMWEDILTKETVLNLINKFIFIETKESTDELDGLAYTFENTLFNPEYLNSQIFKDNTYAFETYFFKNKIEAESYSKNILDLDNQILNDEFSNWFRHQYLLYYLALLVMTDININHKNLPLYQKELSFVKYFHEQIGILSDRETNLAKLFFNYGTNIKFFGKIQKGRKDIIKNLKNMAWDIFHLQNTFNNLFIIPKNADFIIPFFISYDQRLKDIAPIYKLKSAAFIKNGFNKHLNFLTDLIDPTIKYEYFTAQAYLKRQEKLKDATEVSIIAKLQIEIEKYEKFLGL